MTSVVEFSDFSWKYKASKNLVLKSINLKIDQGEFIGIMGPTGAGKSTLCSCINGLIPLRTRGWIKGNVKTLGINTRTAKMSELGSRVGLIFQDPETQFIMMTVEDEIAIGLETLCINREEIKNRIQWALKIVELEGYEEKSPDELSGGQKQRVAIASIMAMRPEILILDEPTSDLDPKGKYEVFQILEEIRKEYNLTILLVSHDTKKVLQFCSRVLLLNDGKIKFDGIPNEILQHKDLIQK
ncbi:MAG: energy-coupling factor ABC transporter ATP-binding protein, partial [Promethearchaeota archaeon]